MPPLIFYSSLKGISFLRIEEKLAVSALIEGQELQLVRIRNNPYDIHAIRVRTMDAIDVGWISAELTPSIAPHMDLGAQFRCRVSERLDRHRIILFIQEVQHAPETRKLEEGHLAEHQDGDAPRQAPAPGHRDSDEQGRQEPQQE